jgi:phospholipid/cholesterol/gamma-HCH transport system substrate-binding protein
MMSISFGRVGRLGVVLAFFAVCVGIFIWFLQGTATRVPIIEPKGYEASIRIADIDNIVPASKVRVAGVPVGEVRKVQNGPHAAEVTFVIDLKGVAPLHEGVKVRVGNKSLVGDSYLEIIDGKGAAIPENTTLPDSAAETSTQVDDVIQGLDPQTRTALAGMLRSTGAATAGTEKNVAMLATGLGGLGGSGSAAMSALADQQADLRQLGRNVEVLMNALDEGQGQIADLVTNAQKVTDAVAGQRQSMETTIKMVPGVLKAAQNASGKVTELSGNLAPVAAGLRDSSNNLNESLQQLRPATKDIRGMLPAFSDVQDQAPKTFDKLPALSGDVNGLAPDATSILRDLDPALRYVAPYGLDLGAFFANFNAVFYPDEAGVFYARILAQVNAQTVQSPLKTPIGAMYDNPLPAAKAGNNPGPFKGPYPHVERDGN